MFRQATTVLTDFKSSRAKAKQMKAAENPATVCKTQRVCESSGTCQRQNGR